jgi:hypothetical protein
MMKAAMMAVAILGVAGLGACEKAGEAIDNTVRTERRNDVDSVADAIDGDASTKPN